MKNELYEMKLQTPEKSHFVVTIIAEGRWAGKKSQQTKMSKKEFDALIPSLKFMFVNRKFISQDNGGVYTIRQINDLSYLIPRYSDSQSGWTGACENLVDIVFTFYDDGRVYEVKLNDLPEPESIQKQPEKIWEIRLKNCETTPSKLSDIQFEVTEYELLECLEGYQYYRRGYGYFPDRIEIENIEKVYANNLPRTFTKDFSKIEEMKAKLCGAKVRYEDSKIMDYENLIEEHKKIWRLFGFKQLELRNEETEILAVLKAEGKI